MFERKCKLQKRETQIFALKSDKLNLKSFDVAAAVPEWKTAADSGET